MNNDEMPNEYSKHQNKFKQSFTELSTLIDMAVSMQSDITKQKKEMSKVIFTLSTLVYLSFMFLFVFNFYKLDSFRSETSLGVITITLTFIIGVASFSLYRIKNIMREIKIERAAMQELMEVIFNFRKVIPRSTINVVEMTILDLKLKRLRFY